MPALFTAPRFVALSTVNVPLPGAKLTFSATGTSNLQNTYQDEDLTVAHANPVIADGAGTFAKIYLDPSLPNYRVLLTDSANVTQPGYPIDEVPSNQNQAQTFRIASTAPELIFEETDASTGNKKWSVRASAEQLTVSLLNDAESVRTDIARFDRSGTTSDLINLLATQVQSNSLEMPGSLAVKKSADTDRSSTTTLADDPHLTLSVPVAGIYRIEVSLVLIGPTGGAGGFKYKLTPTNGTTGVINASGVQSINSVTSIGFDDSIALSSYGTLGVESFIQRTTYARLTPTGAMTIKLQWAQSSSNAAVTRLSDNSLLSITRIMS